VFDTTNHINIQNTLILSVKTCETSDICIQYLDLDLVTSKLSEYLSGTSANVRLFPKWQHLTNSVTD